MSFIHQIRFLLVPSVILIFLSLACSVPGLSGDQPSASESVPEVTISSPAAGQQIELGSEVEIISAAQDTEGIVRTELIVDGEVLWVDANADPQPNEPFIVAQPWKPNVPGSHVLEVKSYNSDNVSGQSEPVTVEVVAASAQTVDDNKSPLDTVEPQPPAATDTPVAALEDVPTNTPTPLPPATASPQPATPTPTIPLPTPSVTPTPGVFASTGLEPEGRFREIWLELGAGDSRLGHPTGPEISDRDFAKQIFEGGVMYWWDSPDDPDVIWVIDSPEPDLKSGATSNRYPDEWAGGNEYACDQARGNAEKGPLRGFGWLWCQHPELQVRLGNPVESEVGSGGNPPYGRVLFFQGGVMIYNPKNGEVYVLFDQGDWQRFNW
jgi:hypothetical protein